MPPSHPPRTSSTTHPVLQNTSRIDAPENPEIMKAEIKTKGYKVPLLRFRANDVCCEGASAFFDTGLNIKDLMEEAVLGVLDALYTPATQPTHVRSVTLILRSMDGVAYTTGSDLDNDHKEIHFSTNYIAGVSERSSHKEIRKEILGVIRHEMVHCFQYNARGTCNGGLIEGIADWVREKGGFVPPHWRVGGGDKWDDGYQNTAYFLLWLEAQYGPETVPRINRWLKDREYTDNLFGELFGQSPEALFSRYKKESKDAPEQIVLSEAGPSSETTNKTGYEADDKSPKAESYVEVPIGSPEPEAKLNERTVSLFQISEMRLIARKRLSHLSYDGTTSLRRFISLLESLIEVIDPKMPDRERKLLFATSLKGSAVKWFDNFDPNDQITFQELKTSDYDNRIKNAYP